MLKIKEFGKYWADKSIEKLEGYERFEYYREYLQKD